MARSLCFMAFAILAMLLFVAYDVEAIDCKRESNTFPGICLTKLPCRRACISEKFTDGHCSKILRRCLCTKPCVFDEKMIKTGAEKVSWRNLLLVSNVIPRNKFTAWLAAHHRLPTVDRLARFGIQIPMLCSFCNQQEESFCHLYFECCITRSLWSRVCTWLGNQRQILSWDEELELACRKARSVAWRNSIIAAAFVHVTALIWRARNNIRFQSMVYDEGRIAREAAMLIHMRGKNNRRWRIGLQQLNSFP